MKRKLLRLWQTLTYERARRLWQLRAQRELRRFDHHLARLRDLRDQMPHGPARRRLTDDILIHETWRASR